MEISVICIECGEKLEYENHLVTTPEKRISVVAITPCKTCRPTPRALDGAYCTCDDMYYSKYKICPTCKKPYP